MASEWAAVRIEDIAEKIAMGPFGSNIKVETFVYNAVAIIISIVTNFHRIWIDCSIIVVAIASLSHIGIWLLLRWLVRH
jgi:hypothetical protein